MGSLVVQRVQRLWNHGTQKNPDYVYASSFDRALVLSKENGVITQAQQGDSGTLSGHSELFLEYWDGSEYVMEQIHFSTLGEVKISIKPYNVSGETWRTRLPRGASWIVTQEQIGMAKEAALALQHRVAKKQIEYAQWFGTTQWKDAGPDNVVPMHCKDVTDAILMEAGILRARQAKIMAFNCPSTIAGHYQRDSVAPDLYWKDKVEGLFSDDPEVRVLSVI